MTRLEPNQTAAVYWLLRQFLHRSQSLPEPWKRILYRDRLRRLCYHIALKIGDASIASRDARS